jgi:uncharacterized protein YeaO (DUF488 family)
MTLQVRTSRLTYRLPDRLDVTRKSGKEGLFLAPSWAILMPVILARKSGTPEEEVWCVYERCYLHEMRHSYKTERAKWDALLARESVTLVCYCTDETKCHRHLLRTKILPALGAVDGGEVWADGEFLPMDGVKI